jgi:hypothetical protein
VREHMLADADLDSVHFYRLRKETVRGRTGCPEVRRRDRERDFLKLVLGASNSNEIRQQTPIVG